MAGKLSLLTEQGRLKKKLDNRRIDNSGFIHRVFEKGERYRIYSTPNLETAAAIHESRNHMIFAGDWGNAELPLEILPAEGVFVSSSPLEAVELLKTHYALDGEWPCWHFLAPERFGPGPWDALGPLRVDEVPTIFRYWTLSDDPEKEMTERVMKYDSACIREEGKPVSWCGLHFDILGVGNMGFAHTIDEHRRKGYASLVTKSLVNRLADRGRRATVHVIKDNHASVALCKSMGFSTLGELGWANFVRRV